MAVAVTPIYAALLTLLFLALSVHVVFGRFAAKVSVGDGDDEDLRKRMRVQANCAEYAPIGIVLLLIVELQGAPSWVLHLLGLMLLAGRVMHAYGFGSTPQIMPLRKWGMRLTLLMLLLSAIGLLGHALF